MVRPACFGWNLETAATNHFQQQNALEESEIHTKAVQEFERSTALLRQFGVKVTVIDDLLENNTPDSIFPNNWFSSHPNGSICLYPMQAKNRRRERRMDVFSFLAQDGWSQQSVFDLSYLEEKQIYLEGTGSLVLDRSAKLAFASLSERTHESAVRLWCEKMDYQPILFEAFDLVEGKKVPIYHTNVILCIGTHWAVVCLEAMEAANAWRVEQVLALEGKKCIPISLHQMKHFAGNMLELNTPNGPIVVMSESARNVLSEVQLTELEKYATVVPISIPTIEEIGGGSIRCMLAELFR
jgi:hypothetical protein